MQSPLNIVFIGLSITSAWGNCHASAYRALIKGLQACGHNILFLEWDAPWFRQHRDLPAPEFCEVGIYDSIETLKASFEKDIRNADAVIVGSYTYEGIQIGHWVLEKATGLTVFYDLDTPFTLVRLHNGGCGYVSMDLIPRYDIYLSSTGGPILKRVEVAYRAKRVYPLYCSLDPDLYYPEAHNRDYTLGYIGNYNPDRQPGLERYLVDPARFYCDRRFAIAGANFPVGMRWPGNIDYMDYLPPERHREYYGRQWFALNITRPDVIAWGYSPSIRLLEAAACGVPVISDYWVGMEDFFKPGVEIVTVQSTVEVMEVLDKYSPEVCISMGEMARSRVLQNHSGVQRAWELVACLTHVAAGYDQRNIYREEATEGRVEMQQQLLDSM